MVGGKIGFAFRAVNDQRIYFFPLRHGKLHCRRKGRSAHADDTHFPAKIGKLRGCQLVRLGHGMKLLPRILKVIINDDGIDLSSVGYDTGNHVYDLAGNRGVNRRTDKPGRLPYFLSCLHQIALLNQRLAGRADMLRKGIATRDG